MPDFTTGLLAVVAVLLGVHLLSCALTVWRAFRPARPAPPGRDRQPVSLLRPVCGLDPNDDATLRSTFLLDPHPALEIVFCAARDTDPAVALLRRLMREYPHVRARVLIGDDRPTANPKLNNLVKGWHGSDGTWVIMADSNVLLPPDYVTELHAAYRGDTGLVCSPPVGSAPDGLAAEVECAFLNTYQGRFQLAADSLGFGFAQGKTMFWQRGLLDGAGGIEALARDAAEDAAATKIVRATGRRVRLVDRPYPQPLGRRLWRDVWQRQVRWARLRRATFPLFYAPEILAGGGIPVAAAGLIAGDVGVHPAAAMLGMAAVWYGAEAAVARLAGWHFSTWSPLALIARDAMLPAVWIAGWTGNGFTWRGNEMSATVTASEVRWTGG